MTTPLLLLLPLEKAAEPQEDANGGEISTTPMEVLDPEDLDDEDGDDAEAYQAENPEEDHADDTEGDLEDLLDAIIGGMDSAPESLQKAWSEAARVAAAASRGKAGRNRTSAAVYTGLKHRDMNSQGFIRTEKMTDKTVLARARDHNNARAQYLKARKNFLDIVKGNRDGDLKGAGSSFKQAGKRMLQTGTYFRMANTARNTAA